MQKHSVNLIIEKQGDSPGIAKLKIILPIIAVASLFIFVVSFFSSILYINNNSQEYLAIKNQIETLEKKIAGQKNTEGIYTLTVSRISTVDKLSANGKNFGRLLNEIVKLQTPGTIITQTTIDKKNSVTFSVVASSSATLDEFVTSLYKAEAEKLFSEIKSSGIVRDKFGSYLLAISTRPNSNLLQ